MGVRYLFSSLIFSTVLFHQVAFADGQAIATISLTIRDDTQAEIDETSLITLTDVIEPGTILPNKGAVLGVYCTSLFYQI